MDKIIFFHMNQLGDLLFSLPVLKAARQKYPNVKIYCVARKNLAGLLESTKLVDKIFLKVGSLGAEIDLIAAIRKEKIDALGHDIKLVKGTSATCEESGTMQHYKCKRCEKSYDFTKSG